MEEDVINHPSHYERLNVTVRPIDCFERFSTNIGCACKYLFRDGNKNGNPPEKDLKKARWYLNNWMTMKSQDGEMKEAVNDTKSYFSYQLVLDKASRLLPKNVFMAIASLFTIERNEYGGLAMVVTDNTCKMAIGCIDAELDRLKKSQEDE